MKKLIHLSIGILAIAALGLSSCQKALVADYTIGDISMTMSANTLAQHYQLITVQLDHNQIVKAINSAGAKDISRVTSMSLKQMKAVTTNTGGNFDGILDVEVYFKSSLTATDSSQIAYSGTLNTGDTQATLQMTGSDMKAALSSDGVIVFKMLNKTTGNTTAVNLTQGIIEMNIRN